MPSPGGAGVPPLPLADAGARLPLLDAPGGEPALGEHDGAGDPPEEFPALGISTPRGHLLILIGRGTLKTGQTIDEKVDKLTVVNNLGLFSVSGRTCIAVRAGAEGTSRSLAREAKRGHDQLGAFLAIPPLDEKENTGGGGRGPQSARGAL